jgi:hypothetical protein
VAEENKMAKNKAPTRPARRLVKRSAARKPAATVRVSVPVEKDLVAAAEQFARARRTTLAALVAEGLRKVSGAEKVAVLPPGDVQAQPAQDAGPWAQLLAWMEEQQAALTEIRNQLGDVAASLPNDPPGGTTRPQSGTRIPPP